MDRQPTQHHPAPSAPRGALAAVAAVAALLLSVAMIASAPRSSLTSLAGARIVFLGTADAAHAAATEHPTTSGHAPACQAPAGNAPHAALAARRAVLVRHTSLPPPARA